MEPSECCIFRIVIASLVGAFISAAMLGQKSILVAILAAPIVGSLMAIAAMVLFQFVRPFISKDPIGLDPHADYFARKLGFR